MKNMCKIFALLVGAGVYSSAWALIADIKVFNNNKQFSIDVQWGPKKTKEGESARTKKVTIEPKTWRAFGALDRTNARAGVTAGRRLIVSDTIGKELADVVIPDGQGEVIFQTGLESPERDNTLPKRQVSPQEYATNGHMLAKGVFVPNTKLGNSWFTSKNKMKK